MWATIITVVLQIIGWGISKLGITDKAKKRFFEFVKRTGKRIDSVKLYKFAEAQLKQFASEEFKPEPGQQSD